MRGMLWRSSWGWFRRHRWSAILAALGIALGIAVVVSIDLASQSARRAFQLSAEAVTGRATHSIEGGSSGLPEDVYRRIRTELGIEASAPVIEGFARVPGSGRTLQVLGLDPFAEASFRPYLAAPNIDLRAILGRPGTALLSASTAQELGLRLGDSFTVRVEGVDQSLQIVGLLQPRDSRSRSALENLLLTDVSTAQELLGKVGRLDRVDLIVPKDDATFPSRVAGILPPGAQIVRASSYGEALDQLTQAFRLNLSALSLLALLVGTFLIYNAMTFSVVQRRELLGTLRALGVSKQEIFTLILAEAAVLAVVGTIAGFAGGIALGNGMVRLVTQTLNDLYFVVNVRQLSLAPLTFIKGLALGIGASLLAALAPAVEATRTPPTLVLQRSDIESRARRRLPELGAVGALLVVIGAAFLAIPSHNLGLAFVGLFAVLVGFALMVPIATSGLAMALRRPLGFLLGPSGRMAASGIHASVSRTGIAVAALSIAVATAAAVALMVNSFRGTVARWLENSLIADVYVSAPTPISRRGQATIQRELVDRLRRTAGVSHITSVRPTRVRWGSQSIILIATELGSLKERPYRFQQGSPSEIWRALDNTDAIAISEPFAFHHGVGVGQILRLATDHGEHDFSVRGIYYDYASDAGTVLMSRQTYDRHFDDRGVSGLGFFAAPGMSAEQLAQIIRRAIGNEEQQLLVRTNVALREASLDIFDRTFAITRVLRLLSMGVAFIGILSALMAVQLERAREHAVLRAIGLFRRELWKLVTVQTTLMGLFAGILSLPLGLLLAYILVHVINKRSFGWTLQLTPTLGLSGQPLVLAMGAALLAGLYPAWRISQIQPAQALKEL